VRMESNSAGNIKATKNALAWHAETRGTHILWIPWGRAIRCLNSVTEKVIAMLASVKRIPADKITLETKLQELGIDSLDVFSLLFEQVTQFEVQEAHCFRSRSLQSLVLQSEYLAQRPS
jgi:hypothetical protein